TDVNGAPEEMTDGGGNIVWEAGYQVWGNLTHEKETRPVQQNLRFQGQYLDRETGLHYNLYRFYDPDIGKFISGDPISIRGGINLYQYAPNPLSWNDPLGLTKAPVYENPGHHDPNYLPNRQVPFNSSKSVIPPNAEDLFKLSQIDPDDPKTRWTKVGEGKKSVWHRFQSSAADGSGAFHWNGSTDGVDIKGRPRAIDIKNVPRSARNMKGCKL
ncbi:TPA: RHS repeat domain-containing protein, partial [Salmonella enterica subsp. enterica serovar Wangata]